MFFKKESLIVLFNFYERRLPGEFINILRYNLTSLGFNISHWTFLVWSDTVMHYLWELEEWRVDSSRFQPIWLGIGLENSSNR